MLVGGEGRALHAQGGLVLVVVHGGDRDLENDLHAGAVFDVAGGGGDDDVTGGDEVENKPDVVEVFGEDLDRPSLILHDNIVFYDEFHLSILFVLPRFL